MKTDQANKRIYLQILTNNPSMKFNLTKEGSNFSTNQIILNSLIGTLVKYGPSGRIEPYIAESWEISPDRKTWIFKIREGLECDDGTSITAQLFHDSLTSSLQEYSKKSSVIMFDYLIGWNDFKSTNSKSLEGLKVNDNNLEFHFTQYPDDILELLRMPYFGIWKKNSNDEIISSASYKLQNNHGNKVTLKLRNNWFNSNNDSFKEVEASFIEDINFDEEFPANTITLMPFNSKSDTKVPNSFWINQPPTILDTFVLSPHKINFFNNPMNRQIFLNRVNSLSKNLIRSQSFYPSAPSKKIEIEVNSYIRSKDNQPLTFVLERANLNKEELLSLNQIINFALEGSGLDYQIISRDLNDEEMMQRLKSNDFYDARIASVDTGAHPIYTAIKMMFCTQMGISFPGHEEEFCRLIEKNLTTGKEIDQSFIDSFNKSLQEKAIVIPIAHHSPKWLVSDTLDPHYLPATTPYPQFDLLKNK